jgi:beta-phosphoglucomutase-like phosphatase (HAD superfamily)
LQQLACGCGLGDGGGEHWHGLDDIESGAAQELMDRRFVQAGCVVLDTDCFFGFVQIEAANTIDLPYLRQGEGSWFCRRDSIAVQNIKLCHALDHISGSRGSTVRKIESMAIAFPEGTFSALIFDCDGTLVDSAPAHLRSLQQALEPLGLSMAPEWYGARHGLGPDALIDEYEAEFKPPAIDRKALFERNNIAYQLGIPLIQEIAFVANIARAWHGRVPMSVASNGVCSNVEATLKATNLRQLFDYIVTSEDVKHGKPAPDVYLEAARRMKVEPMLCIVFEDSDEGLEAAGSAGMRAFDIRAERLRQL